MSIKRLALLLCAVLVLGVAACGGDDDGGGQNASAGEEQQGSPAGGTGGTVHIAFSAPAADHGWLKAISDNAKAEGDELDDVDLTVNDSAANSAEQADQIETLINEKPDVLVILPFEGDALTPVAEKATAAGIPVINVDREFSTPGAYRTWIGGDNYGIGWQAGNYFADELKCKGNVVEIQGLAGISVTELRTKGFSDAIEQRCKGGIKVVARQPADFLPDKGLSVMENILQAQPTLDAVFAHNDEMALGALQAVRASKRPIKIVGFDATDDAVKAVNACEMAATVAQQPREMGSLSVEKAAELAKGGKAPAKTEFIPVPLKLVTSAKCR
jgi:ribose transport system substrate-binding protein